MKIYLLMQVFCGTAARLGTLVTTIRHYSNSNHCAIIIFIRTCYPALLRVKSQTVSELSAIGAPTRPLWVLLAVFYTLLVIAFGYGIRISARGKPYEKNIRQDFSRLIILKKNSF